MNNNMPNNFNNGIPNNNPKPTNNFVGGPEQAAKEQLAGGQSTVGNGPSVMQGMPNVQNNRGVMQGTDNAINTPGVMQGNSMQDKSNTAPVMPGQGNSGINAFTMQKEEPAKNGSPEVVSIPNFAPNMPEAPKPNPTVPPIQNPNGIGNPMPNINQRVNNGMPLNNDISMSMPEANKEPLNKIEENTRETQIGLNVNKPIADQSKVSETSTIQTPNNLGQGNNQNLNNFPFNNVNQMGHQNEVNGQGLNPTNQPTINQPINNESMNSQAINSKVMQPSAMNNTNNSMVGDANRNASSATSQIGQTVPNSLNNDVVEMPNAPEKKFPLSTREMILIGIALIGIVAVIIVYWPK